jgi:cell division initiation protein
MPLTFDDIEKPEVRRAWLRGYARDGVDRLLREVADSLEEALLERSRLAEQVEKLESEAASHRELEALLRSTLVSAERIAQDVKEQARREADLIVQEAHAQGRRDNRHGASERERLEEDLRKIRALLRSALDGLGAARDASGSPADRVGTDGRRLDDIPESADLGVPD